VTGRQAARPDRRRRRRNGTGVTGLDESAARVTYLQQLLAPYTAVSSEQGAHLAEPAEPDEPDEPDETDETRTAEATDRPPARVAGHSRIPQPRATGSSDAGTVRTAAEQPVALASPPAVPPVPPLQQAPEPTGELVSSEPGAPGRHVRRQDS
jgi:hypothetical protein